MSNRNIRGVNLFSKCIRITFIYEPAFSIYGASSLPFPLSIKTLDFRYMAGATVPE